VVVVGIVVLRALFLLELAERKMSRRAKPPWSRALGVTCGCSSPSLKIAHPSRSTGVRLAVVRKGSVFCNPEISGKKPCVLAYVTPILTHREMKRRLSGTVAMQRIEQGKSSLTERSCGIGPLSGFFVTQGPGEKHRLRQLRSRLWHNLLEQVQDASMLSISAIFNSYVHLKGKR
jgi:hypothetical protein